MTASYFVLIDTAGMRLLKRCPSSEQAHAWRHLIAAKDYVVIGDTRRYFSQFDEQDLRRLCVNSGRTPPASIDYLELINGAHAIAAGMPLDDTSEEKLKHGKRHAAPAFQADKAGKPGKAPAKGKATPPAVADPPGMAATIQPAQGIRTVMLERRPDSPAASMRQAPPWQPPAYNQGLTSATGVPQSEDAIPANPTESKAMSKPKTKAGKSAAKAKAAPKAKPAKAAKAKPTKAAKPAKAAKPDRIVQNDVARPKAGSTCAAIWDAADKISAKLKVPAPIADVMAACMADKLTTEGTVRTQYQKWRTFNGLSGRLAAAK